MKVEVLRDFGKQKKGIVIEFPDSQYKKCSKLGLIKETSKNITLEKPERKKRGPNKSHQS